MEKVMRMIQPVKNDLQVIVMDVKEDITREIATVCKISTPKTDLYPQINFSVSRRIRRVY